MEFNPGLTVVANLDPDALLLKAKQEGIPAYVLTSTGVLGRESFFDAVRASLPLDPPLLGSRSWDALSDSLWEGLHTIDADRVIIIWPNSAAMCSASRTDYELALNVLRDVATSLADPLSTNGKPKVISVYVG